MIPRIFKRPESSFFLLGPRGTGKSTWIEQNFSESQVIQLLDGETYQELSANPTRLNDRVMAMQSEWAVIDEVQKIPSLLDQVHLLIEKKKKKFVLTGSSARKLKSKNANLLAGRAHECHFHPFTVPELDEKFNLKHSIHFGHLPKIYSLSSDAEKIKYLKSYTSMYLREEILQEGVVRNVESFNRFIEAASFSQGSVINASSIARELGRDSKTITEYFQILEDLLIGVRLPVFTKRAKRKMTTHPKFYFFDAGVFQAIRPKGSLDDTGSRLGIALETLVMQELRAQNDAYEWGFQLSFWRSLAKEEVDFVLYGELGLIGIEVKLSDRIRPEDLKSLNEFKSDYPVAKVICLYTGAAPLQIGSVQVLPVDYFLKNMKEILVGK